MSDLDIVVENILNEDDDVESKKEQNAWMGLNPILKTLQIKSSNLS